MPVNIEELYIKYGPMVLRRCRQLLKNEEAALDAMQDTFVNLLRHENSLHAAYPSSLLYRVATNVCLNIIRKKKKDVDIPSDDIISAIAGVDNVEEKVVAGDLINRIFRTEKPSTKLIAVMIYVDKMTLGETADEVGLSISGVRKRLRILKEKVSVLKEVEM